MIHRPWRYSSRTIFDLTLSLIIWYMLQTIAVWISMWYEYHISICIGWGIYIEIVSEKKIGEWVVVIGKNQSDESTSNHERFRLRWRRSTPQMVEFHYEDEELLCYYSKGDGVKLPWYQYFISSMRIDKWHP